MKNISQNKGIKNASHRLKILSLVRTLIETEKTKKEQTETKMSGASSPSQWTVKEVSIWLASIGFQEYVPTFAENLIDGKVLFDLNESDLEEIGVETLGHIKKMISHCELLKKAMNQENGFSNSVRGENSEARSSVSYELKQKKNSSEQSFEGRLIGDRKVGKERKMSGDRSRASENISFGEASKLEVIVDMEKKGMAPALPDNPEEFQNSPLFRGQSPTEWSVEDVCRWLRDIELEQYKDTFVKNQIDGRTLLDINRSDLQAIGVVSIGHQKKITGEIKLLQDSCEDSKPLTKTAFLQLGSSSMQDLLDDEDDLINSTDVSSVGECKVCFDGPIDCVLVECGHM